MVSKSVVAMLDASDGDNKSREVPRWPYSAHRVADRSFTFRNANVSA
jgi:hypothetical protein